MERGCGIFLPVSSLPNKYGYGCFSEEAYKFIDFLSDNNIKYWHILPINDGKFFNFYGNYYSSFAGNPLFLDIESMLEIEEINFFKLDSNLTYLEYEEKKKEVLKYLFDKLYYSTNIDKFIEKNEYWVYDYAVYMVLKDELKCNYLDFPACYKNLDSSETISFIKTHSEEIIYYIFLQYLFFKQWDNLKKYANQKGIKIISELSINSPVDSSDVYGKNEYFQFENGELKYFSAQQKDNFLSKCNNYYPIFNFSRLKKDNYSWFVTKYKFLQNIYDFVIINDSQDLISYYKVPFNSKNINDGTWEQGCGEEIFEILKNNNVKKFILNKFVNNKSEDVEEKENYPIVKFMSSAFNFYSDKKSLPSFYEKNIVSFLENYSNENFLQMLDDDLIKEKICNYLNIPSSIEKDIIIKKAIESLISSNSNICIINIQDILSERENKSLFNEKKHEIKLKNDYQNDKYFDYLKELIKNKNR